MKFKEILNFGIVYHILVL